ncbi:hypothetical protein GCM10010178_41870 [Lentzea flava]|uniref:Uncharacterized protein n=1 Tax=Lentzea flava TaxID=103732 RepID=A0ABQ2UP87_9PSEU|nr:hypothetical protein GCM10010178_41870 [Lentzea flava]
MVERALSQADGQVGLHEDAVQREGLVRPRQLVHLGLARRDGRQALQRTAEQPVRFADVAPHERNGRDRPVQPGPLQRPGEPGVRQLRRGFDRERRTGLQRRGVGTAGGVAEHHEQREVAPRLGREPGSGAPQRHRLHRGGREVTAQDRELFHREVR